MLLSVKNTKSVLKTSISRTKDGKKSESEIHRLADMTSELYPED
jgi:hypothetical protein